jgi:hypothetical protein
MSFAPVWLTRFAVAAALLLSSVAGFVRGWKW